MILFKGNFTVHRTIRFSAYYIKDPMVIINWAIFGPKDQRVIFIGGDLHL
jgi:hypothetical protein